MPRHDAVTVDYLDAGTLRRVFTLPPPTSDRESVLAFSLPGAGSTLLNAIMLRLSDLTGLTYVSLSNACFRVGLDLDQCPPSARYIFRPHGYCYGGFRRYPTSFTIPLVGRSKIILLVRDPRDTIVSHYFALRYCHPVPGNEMRTGRAAERLLLARRVSVDEFALAASELYRRWLARYVRLLGRHPGEVRLFRYEDVIFNKGAWVCSICDFFGWQLQQTDMEGIGDALDIIPAREDTTVHYRQVLPGDAARKLKPETMVSLTDIFQRELGFFGYARGHGDRPADGETTVLASPMPERLEIGSTHGAGVIAIGLFGRETVKGRPLRWTGGLAEFAVRLNPATLPTRVMLKIWGLSPASGTDLRVLVNDVELVSTRIEKQSLHADLPLPTLGDGTCLVLRLESSTFKAPGDPRTLGVAIESIELCR